MQLIKYYISLMQANSNFTKSIHLCIYLNRKDRLVPSSELAESLMTNPVVVRRLIALLKAKKIIGSVAGTKGGFFLERSAKKITLWDIYLAVRENDFFNRPKVNPDCIVSSNLAVLVHDTFSEAEQAMEEVLNERTIQNLTEELKNILAKKRA